MAAADDKVNSPIEENEGIILLTEVMGEPPSELVLEISAGKPDLSRSSSRKSLPHLPQIRRVPLNLMRI